MSIRRSLAVLILLVATGTALADFKQQNVPAKSYASTGDVAVGEIIAETDERLELNIRPCAGAATVIVFRKPYLKEGVETVHCASAAKAQAQVIQK